MQARVLASMLLGLCAILVAACDGDEDGSSTSTPAAPTAAATAEPSPDATPAEAITVVEPAADTTVNVPFKASGTASVFEGALTVDVLGNAAGRVLCTRNVQASEGGPGTGTWSAPMAFAPPPADSPVTLRAYSFSAADGSMENLVERTLTASAEQPNIVITTPRCGETVAAGSMLTVSGMASVFEAVLHVDIRDASGTAVLTERVMAASGTEFSPWTTTFDLSTLPEGGLYDVVAFDLSARDGAIENEFPVQILLGP